MTFKTNFKMKLCTLALIASFVLSIVTPAVADVITTRVYPVTATDVANLGNKGNVYSVGTIATAAPGNVGGAVYNNYATPFSIAASFDKSSISSDTYSVSGGAIHNEGTIGSGTVYGITGSFTGNYATTSKSATSLVDNYQAIGGAISNYGTIGTAEIAGIKNAKFTSNSAKTTGNGYYDVGTATWIHILAGGGAIANFTACYIYDIDNTEFQDNKALGEGEINSASGGAIYNGGTIGDITGGCFKNNQATASGLVCGGAISNESIIGIIRNVTFENNLAAKLDSQGAFEEACAGGAISNGSSGTITGIADSIFAGNCASLSLHAKSTSARAMGGAIYNLGDITDGITSVIFYNNSAVTSWRGALGGALYTNGDIASINNSSFINNKSQGLDNVAGGAIYISGGGKITNGITDTDFIGNFAEATAVDGTAEGGAIYSHKNSILIKAENKDVTFRGNYVKAPDMTKAKGSAIYLDNAKRTITLDAAQGRKIIFEDDQTIEGKIYEDEEFGEYYGYNVNVEGGGTVEFLQENTPTFKEGSGIYSAGHVTVSGGTTLVISNLSAMALTLNDGTIDFIGDGQAKAYSFGGMYDGSTTTTSINLKGVGGCLKLDADLSKSEMDSINVKDSGTATIDPTAKLHITSLALLKDSAQDITPIPFTSNEDLKIVTQYDGAEELASHANKYKVRYDNTTGNFIFTKSGVSATTESMGDRVNVMNFVWLETVNNLQKRLGDLRGGEESDMAWARFQRNNDDHKTSREFNVSGNLYQVGYDFALKNQVASRGYFGVSLEAFDGTQSYQIGGGDVKSMSLGAYYTKIYDSGHYFDFILRYGRLENDSTSYDATAGLSGILTKLDYAMNSVTLSGEYGYRWNMGNAGLYLEPQAEFIYGYLSGAQATSSTNYLADIDSTNHFVTRLGLAFGQRVKNFNYYLRGSYYHDFAGTIHIKYGGTPYQQDSAQNWWEVSLGGGWNISKLSYFYAELTKHFKDVSNSLNFNLGFRFTL